MHPDIANIEFNKSTQIINYDPSTGLLAINKPTSIKSHPNQPASIDKLSIILAPYSLDKQFYQLKDHRKLYLLNRLDSPTSGLLLLSFNKDTAAAVKQAFKDRLVKKSYLAILIGHLHHKKTSWKNNLSTTLKNNTLRTSHSKKNTQEAITNVQLLHFENNLSFVKLSPITGFTHQLRVQAALNHLPILNDKTYGNFSLNKQLSKQLNIKQLCLHSYHTSLSFLLNNTPHHFSATSPLPNFWPQDLIP